MSVPIKQEQPQAEAGIKWDILFTPLLESYKAGRIKGGAVISWLQSQVLQPLCNAIPYEKNQSQEQSLPKGYKYTGEEEELKDWAKNEKRIAELESQEQPYHVQVWYDFLSGKGKVAADIACFITEQLKKTESQEQPESEDEWIKTTTIWCEIIHAIAEADKKNENVGSFIPRFLEPNYTITRKQQQ